MVAIPFPFAGASTGKVTHSLCQINDFRRATLAGSVLNGLHTATGQQPPPQVIDQIPLHAAELYPDRCHWLTGVSQSPHSPDLVISGAIYDFLTLATHREDSDTLYFQSAIGIFNRRVVMEGDTALRLKLKNLLDGMDWEALGGSLPPLLRAAGGLMAVHERLNSEHPVD